MKFKHGAVIKTYDVKGRKVVFRWPRMSDAKALTDYRNSLVAERPPVLHLTRPDMTVEKERKYITKVNKSTKEKKMAFFIMEVDGKLACSLHSRRMHPDSTIQGHVVEVGLGLNREFRGMGLGHTIMEGLEHVSRKYLKAKVIYLWVMEYNRIARSLYRKNGYKETGRLLKAIKYKNKYYDMVLMCKVFV